MTFLDALYAKREAEQLIESQISRIAQMVLWLHGADISNMHITVYVEPIKDKVTALTNFHDLKYDYIGGKDDEAFVAVNATLWVDGEEEVSNWYNLPKSWLVGGTLDDNIDFIRNDLIERKKRMQEHKEYVKTECERMREERIRAEVERKQKADAERAALEKEERRKMYEELKKEFEPAKDIQTIRRSYNLYDFDTELDGWLYNHLGILAEALNKEDHLGWDRGMVLEACYDKKRFEKLNKVLIDADNQFGADAAYWGVCAYGELKHGLIKKGLIDDESTNV